MAFLVCYSNAIDDHVREKAIYLDQKFYRLIFRNCRKESSGYIVLRQISLLRYKSPTILVAVDQLIVLISELEALEDAKCRHRQIQELESVCQNAVNNETNLTISGDMYPELNEWSPWNALKWWNM